MLRGSIVKYSHYLRGGKLEVNTTFEPKPEPKSSKERVGSLIVLLLVVILFAVTNPSTSDFSDHVVNKFSEESDNALTSCS